MSGNAKYEFFKKLKRARYKHPHIDFSRIYNWYNTAFDDHDMDVIELCTIDLNKSSISSNVSCPYVNDLIEMLDDLKNDIRPRRRNRGGHLGRRVVHGNSYVKILILITDLLYIYDMVEDITDTDVLSWVVLATTIKHNESIVASPSWKFFSEHYEKIRCGITPILAEIDLLQLEE